MFFPKFRLNQRIVLSEGTRAYPSILHLKVETAQSNKCSSKQSMIMILGEAKLDHLVSDHSGVSDLEV